MLRLVLLAISYLCTVNANSQWEMIYDVFDSDNFNGLSFIDDSTGYTTLNRVVNDGNEFYQANAILKTMDYGITWDTLYFDIDTCPCPSDSLFNFSDIYFLNEMMGWACAVNTDRVWKTIDGGNSWEIVDTGLGELFSLPPGLADFENVVFHSVDYGIVQNGAEGLHSMETFDGGTTWVVNDDFNCRDISMIDQCNIGLVKGGSINQLDDCQFSSTPFPEFPDNLSRSGTCIEYWNNQNYICGALGLSGASNFASVVRTDVINSSFLYIDFPWASISRDIAFYNEQIGYVSVLPTSINNPVSILKTIDGGYNWYSQEIDQSPDGFPCLSQINCTSENVGYGIAANAVYRTMNGGGPLGTLFSSVIESAPHQNIAVYPNPASSVISIQITSSIKRVDGVEIYGVLGDQVLAKSVLVNGVLTIDLADLNAGVYVLKCYNESRVESCVFVKE